MFWFVFIFPVQLLLCVYEPRAAGHRCVKTEFVFVTALDAALEFQQTQVVPDSWKTEVKEESSSSEEEDEDEEEEQEEDASGEEEEVEAHFLSPYPAKSKRTSAKLLLSRLQEEVEPFPEERENFLQQLYKFMEDRGGCRTDAHLVLKSTVSSACSVFLLCRNSHQQAARSRLQEPEPVQALQAGSQAGRLRRRESPPPLRLLPPVYWNINWLNLFLVH